MKKKKFKNIDLDLKFVNNDNNSFIKLDKTYKNIKINTITTLSNISYFIINNRDIYNKNNMELLQTIKTNFMYHSIIILNEKSIILNGNSDMDDVYWMKNNDSQLWIKDDNQNQQFHLFYKHFSILYSNILTNLKSQIMFLTKGRLQVWRIENGIPTQLNTNIEITPFNNNNKIFFYE